MSSGSDSRTSADKHFKQLREDKTTAKSQKMEATRVKADADKSARLKAARMAKAAETSEEQ
ncbi:hypothetical protein [Aurantimonas sp. 22II-16-19i]|uniref:hypothetical protein n=1 Tax=Aurantimonas sp. 22II-16-19i TaxID=1317114 RepID=UPI0009F7F39D|nr:hypothetical protein [Aurantimonas sp. 22II-16-19i]ORE98647.1 hypothetical protein ATO4_04005 [Aurantimonas sp. 22II-16-19i]